VDTAEEKPDSAKKSEKKKKNRRKGEKKKKKKKKMEISVFFSSPLFQTPHLFTHNHDPS